MFSGIILGILSCIGFALIAVFIAISIINRSSLKPDNQSMPSKARTLPDLDATALLEDLGMPFDKPGYARNVWDMQAYGNRIYLGHGNGTNTGSNANAGPIKVIYYDTAQEKFITQYTVDEEQIDTYKILKGKLFIPGFDSRESWELGNYYYMEDDKWIKARTIPKGVHAYDMELLEGKLFAAIGAQIGLPSFLMSKDNGKSWSEVNTSKKEYNAFNSRTYTLFNFKNKIYALGLLQNMDIEPYNKVIITDGTNSQVQKIGKDMMLPGAPRYKMYRLYRGTVAFNYMIYISAEANLLSYEFTPEGLYCAVEINQAKRLVLPEEGILPVDIIVRDKLVYVMAYKKVNINQYVNIIYKTSDLLVWDEVFRFKYNTFARSFEEIKGDFFFGMGCYAENISGSTGKILRIRACAYEAMKKLYNY